MKQQSAKKGGRLSMGGSGVTSNRRLSLGGPAAHATPKHDLHSVRAAATPNTRTVKKIDRQLSNKDDGLASLSTGIFLKLLPLSDFFYFFLNHSIRKCVVGGFIPRKWQQFNMTISENV